MKTINLQEELIKSKSSQIIEEQLISQVDNVLRSSSEEDLKTLKSAGFLNAQFVRYNELTKVKEWRNTDPKNIFSEDEIKKVALKYCLRFLSTEYYNSAIDLQAPLKIREFEINQKKPKGGYKILAPKECFVLTNKPQKDPLLFADLGKMVDGKHYYYLIHKWGDDLNITRRIKGVFGQSKNVIGLISILISSILIYMLESGAHNNTGDKIALFAFALVLTGIFMVFSCIMVPGLIDNLNDSKWDKPFN